MSLRAHRRCRGASSDEDDDGDKYLFSMLKAGAPSNVKDGHGDQNSQHTAYFSVSLAGWRNSMEAAADDEMQSAALSGAAGEQREPAAQMAAPAPRPADLFAVAPAPRLGPATQPDSEPQHFMLPQTTEAYAQAQPEQQQQQHSVPAALANTEVVARPPTAAEVTSPSGMPSLHEPQSYIKGTKTEGHAAPHEGAGAAVEEGEVEPAESAQAMVANAVQLEAANVAATDALEPLGKQLAASKPAQLPAVEEDNMAAAALEAKAIATLAHAATPAANTPAAENSARTSAEQEEQQDDDFVDAEEELQGAAADEGGDAPVPGLVLPVYTQAPMSPLGASTPGSMAGEDHLPQELAVTASPSAAAAAAGALAGGQGSAMAIDAAGTASAGGTSSLQGSINLPGHVAGSGDHTAEQPRGPHFIRAGVSSLLGILRRSPLTSPQSSPRATDAEALLQPLPAPLAITQALSQHLPPPSASAWNAPRSMVAGVAAGAAALETMVEMNAVEPAAATAPPEPMVEVTVAELTAEVEAPTLADKDIPPVDSDELPLRLPRPCGGFLDLLHAAPQPAGAGTSAEQAMQPELAGLEPAGQCSAERPAASVQLRRFSSDIPPTQVVFIPSQPEADAEVIPERCLLPAHAGAAASAEAEQDHEMDEVAEVEAQLDVAAKVGKQLDEAEEAPQPSSQGVAAEDTGAAVQQHEDEEMPDAGVGERQQPAGPLSPQQQPSAEAVGDEHAEQQLQEALAAEEVKQARGMSGEVPPSLLGPLPPSEPLLPPLGTEALLERVEPTPVEPCASLSLTTVQAALGAMEAAALTPEDAAQAAELAAAVAEQRQTKAAAAAAGGGGEVTSPAKPFGGGEDEGGAVQQQQEGTEEPAGQQLGSGGTAAAPPAAAAFAPLTQTPDLFTQAQFEGFAFPTLPAAVAAGSPLLTAPPVQPSSPAQTPAAAKAAARAGREEAGSPPEAVQHVRFVTVGAGSQTCAPEHTAAGAQTPVKETADAGLQTAMVKQVAAGMQTASYEDVGAQTAAIKAATTGMQASRVQADAGMQTTCLEADAGTSEVAAMVPGECTVGNKGAAEADDAVPQRQPEAGATVAEPLQPMTQEPTLEELPLGPLPDLSAPVRRPSGRLVAVRESGFGGIVHVMRAAGPPPTATSPDQQALAAITARQAARHEATRQVEGVAERASAKTAAAAAEAAAVGEAAAEQGAERSEGAGQQAGRKRSRPWESRPPPPSVLAARAKIQRLASERRYRAALAAASPGPPEELPAPGDSWRPAIGPPSASPLQAAAVQRLLREDAAALHCGSPLLHPSPEVPAGEVAAALGGAWRPSAGPPSTGLAQRRLSGDGLLVEQQHATGLVAPGADFGGQQVASAARPPPPGLSARKLNPLAAAALRSVEWTGGWQQQQRQQEWGQQE